MAEQQAIVVGKLELRVEGDICVITFSGANGLVVARVPAAQLQRWAIRMLRAKAFA